MSLLSKNVEQIAAFMKKEVNREPLRTQINLMSRDSVEEFSVVVRHYYI